jgi:hypothetical protein
MTMKSNKEMRAATWAILRGKWFARLFVVSFGLQAVCYLVNAFLNGAFAAMEIQSFGVYLEKKAQAMQAGLDYTLPTLNAFGWMLGGFCLQMFLGYVFAAIATYGLTKTLLKAHANDDAHWFSNAFGGFARPFEVTGLLVLVNLKVFLWSLLFVVPGLVAVYRYRLAWFLKAERPDEGASACLAVSAQLMKGSKWKAFCLDVSFVGWLLLAGCVLAAGAILGAAVPGVAGRAVAFFAGVLGLYLFLKTLFGFVVSRVVFYRELVARNANPVPAS